MGVDYINDVVISTNLNIHLFYILNKQGVSMALEGIERNRKNILFIPFEENIPLVFGIFYLMETEYDEELMRLYSFLL